MFTLFRHDVNAGEIDHVQVDDVEFVIAGGDAAKALEAVEETFDQVAFAVGGAVERASPGRRPVRMRRRDEGPTEGLRMALAGPAFVGAVGDELRPRCRPSKLFQQMPAPGRIAVLARGQGHHQRQPVVAHDRVQLGRQAPARAAQRLTPLCRGAPVPS